MTPTPKLRFVERQDFTEDVANPRTIRILQQWWEQKGMTMNLGWGGEMPIGEIKGEWRDVPLEVEA
jgi:hypothetical protein